MEKLNIAQNESPCYCKQLFPTEGIWDLTFKTLGFILALPPTTRVIMGKAFYLVRTQFSHLQNGNSRTSQHGLLSKQRTLYSSLITVCVPPAFLCQISDLSLATDSPEGRDLCVLFMPNFQSFANCTFAIKNDLIKFHEGAPHERALPMAPVEHLWGWLTSLSVRFCLPPRPRSLQALMPSLDSRQLAQDGHSTPFGRTNVWNTITLGLGVKNMSQVICAIRAGRAWGPLRHTSPNLFINFTKWLKKF